MPLLGSTQSTIIPAIGLALSLAYANAAVGQNVQTLTTYDVVNPPPCINNKGETVRFVENSRGRSGMAAGMAVRDSSGKPVVLRSNYASAPPEFQSFVDRHECAHHQTGDVDRPHPPRNSSEHLMNESISDCVAILRMRDEDGYNRAAFSRVAAALRHEMAKIGFPEISISSRISNIDNCYTKYGSPQDYVKGILKHRSLP
ncbi:MAG: hypothetical protein V3R37_10785 [Rhodospirillales bacterium]